MKIIETNQPFFADLSFYSVHTPVAASKELVEKYTRRRENLGLKDEFSYEGEKKVRVVKAM